MPVSVDTEQLRRFVLRIRDPASGASLGTGFVVAPGWLLTCAHVPNGRTTLALQTSTGETVDPAAVVRAATPAPAEGTVSALWPFPDVAMVQFTGGADLPVARLDPLGRPDQSSADCVSWGFPIREDDVDPPGSPATFAYQGVEGDGFLSLKAGQANPGLSGGPLVSPDRLAVVGLMNSTRMADTDLGGWATPISALAGTDGSFAALADEVLQQGHAAWLADRTAWQRTFVVPEAATVQAELTSWLPFTRRRRTQPADLLLPEYRVVPFLFHEAELDERERWCLDPGEPTLAAFAPGPGGAGKSRFGIELCARMTERHDWVCGELRSLDEPLLQRLVDLPRPRLVVLDYVEALAPATVADWLGRLEASASDIAPVRILMLDRVHRPGATDDLVDTIGAESRPSVRRILDDSSDVAAGASALSPADRRQLFDAALTAFRAAWNQPPDTSGTDATAVDLASAEFEQPLRVLLLALSTMLGGNDDSTSALEQVLRHEERYWALDLPDEPVTVLRRAVAVVTLCEAADRGELESVLAAVPEFADPVRRRTIGDWLAELHPGPSCANALRPDSVGERLVLTGLLDGTADVPGLLAACTPGQLTRAVLVLHRIASAGEAGSTAVTSAVGDDLAAITTRGAGSAELAARTGELLLDVTSRLLTDGRVETASAVDESAIKLCEYLLSGPHLQLGLRVFATLVELRSRVHGDDDGRTVDARNDLAVILQSAGRMAEAATLYEQNVGICERTLGAEDRRTLLARGNLAVCHWYEQKTAALGELESVLADSERILGPTDPDTVLRRIGVGAGYEPIGRAREAIEVLQRAVEDATAAFGPDDQRTLFAKDYLAKAFATSGDLVNAVAAAQRLLADRERLFGATSTETILCRSLLAQFFTTAGITDHAVELQRLNVTIATERLGPEHPTTLAVVDALAGTLSADGQDAEAVSLYERNAADRRRLLGSDEQATLISLNNLAYAYAKVGDPRSLLLHQQVLATSERVLGVDHPGTLSSRQNVAVALFDAGRRDESVALTERVTAERERVLGPDHPDTITSHENLAYTLDDLGRLAEAITQNEVALTARERTAPTASQTALCRQHLAHRVARAGDRARAIALTSATLADNDRRFGPDSQFSVQLRAELAELGEDPGSANQHAQ